MRKPCDTAITLARRGDRLGYLSFGCSLTLPSVASSGTRVTARRGGADP